MRKLLLSLLLLVPLISSNPTFAHSSTHYNPHYRSEQYKYAKKNAYTWCSNWQTFFVTGYDLWGFTSNGTYVHRGTVAVDPYFIRMGSTVWIEGLGKFHAEDTGGAIKGNRLDVWVPDASEAYALTGYYKARWCY